ncbi:MAG: DUF2993 domain-containing protein [Propionicimonas sp.]|uniref:LmeA family phospholipid-binding protein n=1 Tax=Propionicimonas sp. TaxID=1955623 RepID=UPI003D0C50CD
MRRLLTVLLVLAVLAGGALLADTWVRGQAEQRAAATVQARLGLDKAPTVSLEGFPFSLAFLTTSVPGAHASASRVALGTGTKAVVVTDVLVDADAISLVGSTVRVSRVTGTGVLDYGSLSDLAGVPVVYGGDGRLKLTYTTTIAGRQLTADVLATPVFDSGTGTIRLTDLELVSDDTSALLGKARVKALARAIPVSLPDGVELTGITPAEGGVAVAGLATGLSFSVS